MKLSIYSLKKIVFQGNAVAVNCKTNSGEITVLDNHRPLISTLQSGVVKITDKEQKDHYVPIASGFLEVKGENEVCLLVEQ